MLDFVHAILSFPTVFFTALLVLVAGYWLMVILGALDLHLFDALGSGGDAVDAVGDPHGLGVDGLHGGLLTDVLHVLGLGGVPLTLWFSLVVLFGWIFCLVGLDLFAGLVSPGTLGWLVGIGGLAAAIALTSVAVRPLNRLFATHKAPERKALVGKVCTVTTLRVDENFGQALIEDGGAGLLVQIRCSEKNDLTQGTAALIFDYNPEDEVFHVARFEDAAHETRSGKR